MTGVVLGLSLNLSRPQYPPLKTEVVIAPSAYGCYEDKMGIKVNTTVPYTVSAQQTVPCERGRAATIIPFSSLVLFV